MNKKIKNNLNNRDLPIRNATKRTYQEFSFKPETVQDTDSYKRRRVLSEGNQIEKITNFCYNSKHIQKYEVIDVEEDSSIEDNNAEDKLTNINIEN